MSATILKQQPPSIIHSLNLHFAKIHMLRMILARCTNSSRVGTLISASAWSIETYSHVSQSSFFIGTTVRLSCTSGARFLSGWSIRFKTGTLSQFCGCRAWVREAVRHLLN